MDPRFTGVYLVNSLPEVPKNRDICEKPRLIEKGGKLPRSMLAGNILSDFTSLYSPQNFQKNDKIIKDMVSSK